MTCIQFYLELSHDAKLDIQLHVLLNLTVSSQAFVFHINKPISQL